VSFRASWILPIVDEPIAGGCVSVANGRIAAVGRQSPDAVDLGRVAILPGLVNAHTHLELSHLHGRVPPSARFTDWIGTLMALRRQYPDPAARDIVDAGRAAIRQARSLGTAILGDVSNTLVTVPLLAEAGMPAHVFYELLGFTEADGEARARAAAARAAGSGAAPDVRVSLAPHAPYSVSPALFAGIRAQLDASPRSITSVHLGESADEIEFLERGSGAIRTTLEELGVWNESWRPPGVAPVAYLSDLGFLDSRTLVVHGVQLEGADLSRLGTLDATLVSCPRSNSHVGAGEPPVDVFYAMDVNVAFGTDSLASVADLNMFSELAEARRLAPRVPARRLLESATLVGARALGFGDEFGSIEPGKRAALLAVDVPAGVSDVEEYLVGGIEPAAIRWLDGSTSDSHRPPHNPRGTV
jgi:cytosine/adenosine deaminase-related metal-dependent hydrolase